MAVGILESVAIARNAIGRLRLTRWQLFKLILWNIWQSISIRDVLWTVALMVRPSPIFH